MVDRGRDIPADGAWPFGYGYCCCGCGEKTTVAQRKLPGDDKYSEQPAKFLPGHNRRANPMTGEDAPNWKGGVNMTSHGYVERHAPDHPHANAAGYVYEHRLVASRAMGRPLPEGAEVHHVNGDPSDNRPENLVVCEDRAYHKLLHYRQRSLEATGNPDLYRCHFCGEWDDADNLYISRSTGHLNVYHNKCVLAAQRARANQ